MLVVIKPYRGRGIGMNARVPIVIWLSLILVYLWLVFLYFNFQFKVHCVKVGNKMDSGLYIGFSSLFISIPIYTNETRNIQKLP